MLIKVNSGKGETYINIELSEIAKVAIGNKLGVRYTRGADSFVELKNGKKYLTNPDEAERVVDFMRKQDDDSIKK